MPEGPLGGPRPFASDKKTILVLIGVDGSRPPQHLALDLEQLVSDKMHASMGKPLNTLDVSLTIEESLSRRQRAELGEDAIHAQQYDIQSPWEEITQARVDAMHNGIVDIVREQNFKITGTKTTIV